MGLFGKKKKSDGSGSSHLNGPSKIPNGGTSTPHIRNQQQIKPSGYPSKSVRFATGKGAIASTATAMTGLVNLACSILFSIWIVAN